MKKNTLSLKFKDNKDKKNYEIELKPNDAIVIDSGDTIVEYTTEKKPVYDYKTGEIVTEYSGLASDRNKERSWAIVTYHPKAPLHFHKIGTEDYFFVKGEGEVLLDGKPTKVSAGSHIKIEPKQKHQVVNFSEKEELILIVKCVPSWIIEDFQLK